MNAGLEVSSIEYDFGGASNFAVESCAPSEVLEESAWTRTTVGVLLEECLKKQKEFHKPGHRKTKFFTGIRDSMLERGFVFDVKSLEKKFYNLKKHFFTICKSRESDSAQTKPITWPYHSQMMQMFAEELAIEDAPTMASLYPDIPTKQTSAKSPNTETQFKAKHFTPKPKEFKYGNCDEESRWEHKTVMAFLEECCKKKYELWDPKIRRRKIFGEIRRRLKEKGYLFYQESLDRKLRNMKKQFQVVNDTMQRNRLNRNGRRRRITWPYYEKLKELYGKEMERDARLKRGLKAHAESQFQPTKSPVVTLKFRPIAPKSAEPSAPSVTNERESSVVVTVPAVAKDTNLNDATCTELHPPATSSLDNIALPVVGSNKSHTDAKHEDEKLKFIRQIVAFEERRTIVAEQMLAELMESNKIREKRLEFNRIKLEYAIRRRRKKNGSI